MSLTIRELYKRIEAYHKELGRDMKSLSKEEQISAMRENSLALFLEVAELVESFPWKPWREIKFERNWHQHASEELVDCLFFLVGICEAMDIQPEYIEQAFELKMISNYKRIEEGYNKIKK